MRKSNASFRNFYFLLSYIQGWFCPPESQPKNPTVCKIDILRLFGFVFRVKIPKIRKRSKCVDSTDSARNSHSIWSETANLLSSCRRLVGKNQFPAKNCSDELSIVFFALKSLKSKKSQKGLTKQIRLVTQTIVSP